MADTEKEFVYQLTEWQNELFGYLTCLLGDVHDARDVLQETNLVMWRKMATFTLGTNFGAWARKCAYFQAMAALRDRKRHPAFLSADLLEWIAREEEDSAGPEYERTLALRDCLARLSERHRSLLKRRYQDQTPVQALAEEERKSQSAIKMTLMRLRESLQACIQARLKETTP